MGCDAEQGCRHQETGKGPMQSGSRDLVRVWFWSAGYQIYLLYRISQPKLSGMVWDRDSPSSVEAMAVLTICDGLEPDPTIDQAL